MDQPETKQGVLASNISGVLQPSLSFLDRSNM